MVDRYFKLSKEWRSFAFVVCNVYLLSGTVVEFKISTYDLHFVYKVNIN